MSMLRSSLRSLGLVRPLVLLICAVKTVFVLAFFSTTVLAADQTRTTQPPLSQLGLGRVLSSEEVKALPQPVFSDGSGLPDGQGSAMEGFTIYANACAMCHGGRGEGGRALELVGDRSLLATEFPDRGIAVYWPYAPTLFEYIQRSMPPAQPYSLSNDEVYSVIAALLVMNDLVDETFTLDAAGLSALKLPNRDGFQSLYDHPPID